MDKIRCFRKATQRLLAKRHEVRDFLSPLLGIGTWLSGTSIIKRKVICSLTQSYSLTKQEACVLGAQLTSYLSFSPTYALILNAVDMELKSLSLSTCGRLPRGSSSALYIFIVP